METTIKTPFNINETVYREYRTFAQVIEEVKIVRINVVIDDKGQHVSYDVENKEGLEHKNVREKDLYKKK